MQVFERRNAVYRPRLKPSCYSGSADAGLKAPFTGRNYSLAPLGSGENQRFLLSHVSPSISH